MSLSAQNLPICADKRTMVGESLKQYLTFRIARQDMAVDASRVRRISNPQDIFVLGGLQQGVTGLASMEGQTLIVVDLAYKLNLPRTTIRRQASLVVVDVNKSSRTALVGFIADRVSAVVKYQPADLRSGSSSGVFLEEGFLYGKGRRRRLLDFDVLITDEDLNCLSTGRVTPMR